MTNPAAEVRLGVAGETLDGAVSEADRRRRIWSEHREGRASLAREHPLGYLFLEVTRRCNLACLYCGSTCTRQAQRQEMSIAQWIEVLRQVAADFSAPKIMVAVTGGEPLMKEGVFDIFAELQRLGFPYGMVSNGFLIDEVAARRLVELGMASLSLSMDAPPPLNDALRGRGATAAVIRAIEHLRNAGYDGKLEIISTITRPAVPLLESMRGVVSALRIPLWRVSPVMPIGRAARRPELLPGPEDIRAILEFVKAAREDDYDPSPEMSEEGYVGNRFEGNVRPYLCQCRAGITIGGILCDGRIGACPELGDAFVQGHVLSDRFSQVWRDGYQTLRDRSWTRRGACAHCDQFDRCEGGALHLYEDTSSETLRCLYLLAKQGGG